jgi:cell wall assembly regulator SMI1
MKQVEKVWKNLTDWFATNAPELLETFQPGASEAEIADLERHVGLELPDDFRTFLKLCNGQIQDPQAGFYSGDLMSVTDIKSTWSMMQGLIKKGTFKDSTSYPGKGVNAAWWNPAWVPFISWTTGDNTCIDLDPAKGGTRGQVIIFWHDQGDRNIKQASFTEWLEVLLADIECGEIVYDREEYDALVNFGDLE